MDYKFPNKYYQAINDRKVAAEAVTNAKKIVTLAQSNFAYLNERLKQLESSISDQLMIIIKNNVLPNLRKLSTALWYRDFVFEDEELLNEAITNLEIFTDITAFDHSSKKKHEIMLNVDQSVIEIIHYMYDRYGEAMDTPPCFVTQRLMRTIEEFERETYESILAALKKCHEDNKTKTGLRQVPAWYNKDMEDAESAG